MSQNNDQNGNAGMAMVLGFIGAVFIALFIVVYAILLFVSFIMTLMCIFAWDKDLHVGKFVLEPREARAFIARGLAGAFLLPAFAIFCEVIFRVRINADLMPHLVLAGYAIGSFCVGLLIEANRAEAEAGSTQVIEHLPSIPAHQLPAPKSGFMPPVKTGFVPQPPPARMEEPEHGEQPRACKCFTFATWDDEEAGR